MTRAKRRASCVFALRRQSETLSCVNALEDRAEQRLVFSHQNLSEPLCLSLPLKRPDWIMSNIEDYWSKNSAFYYKKWNPGRMTRQKSSQNSRQNDEQNTAKKQPKYSQKAAKNQHHSTSSYSQIQLRVSKFLEKRQNYVTNPKKKGCCTLNYVSVFISSKDNMPTWRIIFNKLLLGYGKVLTSFISK
ncbi:hypothetical protein BD560DRAFT_429755 [Blakeslea trispora]|nr:hypothetical protein BD560DRAFT_429755 [Blakeslea trispora]